MGEGSRTILASLTTWLPEATLEVQTTECGTRVWLPQPDAADYRFYVETHEGGAFIGASPNDAPEHAFFWHLPFDYAPEDEEAALAALLEETRRLICNRSRIVQRAGFLAWRFRCDVEEGVQWKRVGGTIARVRLFFLPPFAFRILRREYRSRPLRPEGDAGRPTSG